MKKWVIYLLFLLALVSVASAQYYYTDRGLGSYGLNDIVNLYYTYPYWIDFFISFIIFISLGKIVFGGRGYERGSRGLTIGVALALSFGLIIWESRTGFNLGDIWWFALLVLVFAVGMAVYRYFKNIGLSFYTLSLIALLLGGVALYFLSDFLYGLPTIKNIIYLITGFGVVGCLLWIFRKFSGGTEGRERRREERRTIEEERRVARTERRAEKRAEKERIKEERRVARTERRPSFFGGRKEVSKGRGRGKLKRVGKRKRAEREEKKSLRELEPKFRQFSRIIDKLYRLLSTKPNESTLHFVEQRMYELLGRMRIFSENPEYFRKVRNKMKILKNKFYEVKSKINKEIVIKKKSRTIKPKSDTQRLYKKFKKGVDDTIKLINRGEDWAYIAGSYNSLLSMHAKFFRTEYEKYADRAMSKLKRLMNKYRRVKKGGRLDLARKLGIRNLEKEIDELVKKAERTEDVETRKNIRVRIKKIMQRRRYLQKRLGR